MCVTCVIKLSPSAKQWVENKGKGKVRPKGQVHKKTEKFGRLHQQKNEFSKWISWLPVRHLNHYATTSKKRGSRVIETKHDNSFCLRQNRRGQSQVKEDLTSSSQGQIRRLRKRHEIQGVGGYLLFALVLATSIYITKIIKIRHIKMFYIMRIVL